MAEKTFDIRRIRTQIAVVQASTLTNWKLLWVLSKHNDAEKYSLIHSFTHTIVMPSKNLNVVFTDIFYIINIYSFNQ